MREAPQPEQTEACLEVLRRNLGDALLGVYLHGSAVSRGLQPQSDVDLLAVVERKPSKAQRDGLLTDLLRLSARHPAASDGPRCLEVIVFCRSDLAGADFPMRAAFVYGEWLRATFEAGERPGPERDPEHTLVLAQARQEAIPLYGPPRSDLLPDVSADHVRRAMCDAVPGLLDGLHGDERNVLLTLARMWHTAIAGAFVPKDAAACWALPQLSARHAARLDHARRAYLGEVEDDWTSRTDATRQLAAQMAGRVTASL